MSNLSLSSLLGPDYLTSLNNFFKDCVVDAGTPAVDVWIKYETVYFSLNKAHVDVSVPVMVTAICIFENHVETHYKDVVDHSAKSFECALIEETHMASDEINLRDRKAVIKTLKQAIQVELAFAWGCDDDHWAHQAPLFSA